MPSWSRSAGAATTTGGGGGGGSALFMPGVHSRERMPRKTGVPYPSVRPVDMPAPARQALAMV